MDDELDLISEFEAEITKMQEPQTPPLSEEYDLLDQIEDSNLYQQKRVRFSYELEERFYSNNNLIGE